MCFSLANICKGKKVEWTHQAGWLVTHLGEVADVAAPFVPFVTSQRRRFFLNCLRTHFLKSWRNKGTPFWLWALSLTGERHKMMIEVISWVIFESCWTLKAVYIFAKLWFMGRQMSRFKRVTLQLGASAAVGCSSHFPTSSLVARFWTFFSWSICCFKFSSRCFG